MKNTDLTKIRPYPVAIGGVGGSGTRLIAQFLNSLGYYMGDNLNPSADNLWFTLLFKRVDILETSDAEFHELVDMFEQIMTRDRQFTPQQVKFIETLAVASREQGLKNGLK